MGTCVHRAEVVEFMKQFVHLSLVVAAVFALSSLPVIGAISRSMTVFTPNNDVLASVSVDEADVNGNELVPLDSPDLADPLQFTKFTAVLNLDGTLSDIFGITVNAKNEFVLAFQSGSPSSPIPFPDSLIAQAAQVLPKGTGFLDATSYLLPDLQKEGYRAEFFSRPSPSGAIPDMGRTSSLLGLALAGFAFLRRKLSASISA